MMFDVLSPRLWHQAFEVFFKWPGPYVRVCVRDLLWAPLWCSTLLTLWTFSDLGCVHGVEQGYGVRWKGGLIRALMIYNRAAVFTFLMMAKVT